MSLIGHEEPWAEWRAALGSERMHHAWLLVGPRGMGKGLFARAAAAELVAEAGVPQPPSDRHPDILIPEHPPENKEEAKKREAGAEDFKRKRSIPVDEIRTVQHRLNTRPTLGLRRAVIIDPADDLEKNAANALLKSLEEPPVGTFFLLVCHRPSRLLPTIRSRCRLLRFPALNAEQVGTVLVREAAHTDPATRAAAIAASEGSPGTALEFVDQDLAPLHTIMLRLVSEGDPYFSLRGELAAEIGAKPARERQAATLDLARAVLAAALRGAPKAQQARIVDAHADMARLSTQAPTYNFDPGLLAMEIGGLLASAALPREAA